MRYFKILGLFITLSITTIAISSCNNNASSAEEQGIEYTSAYICPMHCEGSGSEEAGTCPACGMDYVLNENHDSEEHSH